MEVLAEEEREDLLQQEELEHNPQAHLVDLEITEEMETVMLEAAAEDLVAEAVMLLALLQLVVVVQENLG
jgi:hypothetical protein